MRFLLELRQAFCYICTYVHIIIIIIITDLLRFKEELEVTIIDVFCSHSVLETFCCLSHFVKSVMQSPFSSSSDSSSVKTVLGLKSNCANISKTLNNVYSASIIHA